MKSPDIPREIAHGRILLAGLLVAVLAACAGCASLRTSDRPLFTDPVMRADRDPLGTMFQEHIYFTREAAAGGRGVGGGGCGCN